MHSSTLFAIIGAIAAADAFNMPNLGNLDIFHDKKNALPALPFDASASASASSSSNGSGSSASANASASSNGGSSSASAGASASSGGQGGQGGCPAVWNDVVNELHGAFLENGQCNELARQAIRAGFHDCGTYTPAHQGQAGCDGSWILAQEYKNQENRGMSDIGDKYTEMLKKYKVGAGDLIQMGASTAVVTCPLGPVVPTFVGRTDRHTANPTGILPSPFDPAEKTIPLFEGYGLTSDDLVSLLGAHSTSEEEFVDPSKTGQASAQDSTPGTWDVKYYGETIDGTAPFPFESDKAIANNTKTAAKFKHFVNNQAGWNAGFASAMTKLASVGVTDKLIDCTSALPKGTQKRDIRAAPIFRRSYH